jgi:hypothetical protein
MNGTQTICTDSICDWPYAHSLDFTYTPYTHSLTHNYIDTPAEKPRMHTHTPTRHKHTSALRAHTHTDTLLHSSFAAATLFFILIILLSILMSSHFTLPSGTYLPQITCMSAHWFGTGTPVYSSSVVFYLISLVLLVLLFLNIASLGRAHKASISRYSLHQLYSAQVTNNMWFESVKGQTDCVHMWLLHCRPSPRPYESSEQCLKIKGNIWLFHFPEFLVVQDVFLYLIINWPRTKWCCEMVTGKLG